MSFADTLKRLDDVIMSRQPGEQAETCRVRRQDLRELLHHFRRLDAEARQNHATPPPQPNLVVSPNQDRMIRDIVRSAYDKGYNDARNVSAIPGDNSPGYRGRDVEKAHADELIARFKRLHTVAASKSSQSSVPPLTWLISKRGGLEAVTEYVTYRAASLASDYAILEIDGKRVLQDFTSVEAACRAAFADHTLRSARAALATTEGKDNG